MQVISSGAISTTRTTFTRIPWAILYQVYFVINHRYFLLLLPSQSHQESAHMICLPRAGEWRGSGWCRSWVWSWSHNEQGRAGSDPPKGHQDQWDKIQTRCSRCFGNPGKRVQFLKKVKVSIAQNLTCHSNNSLWYFKQRAKVAEKHTFHIIKIDSFKQS